MLAARWFHPAIVLIAIAGSACDSTRIRTLDGQVLKQNGRIVAVDLSRGENIPILDDPGAGGVAPTEPLVLSISEPKVIDDDVFAKVSLPPTLLELNRAGCNIGLASIERIKDQCPNLRVLNLSDTDLQVGDFHAISGLSHLTELSLAGMRVDDGCVPSLLELQELVELNIVDTKLSAEAIEKLLKLPKLERLYIFHTPATLDQSAKAKHMLKDPRIVEENPYSRIAI